jgi:hypothetical protein
MAGKSNFLNFNFIFLNRQCCLILLYKASIENKYAVSYDFLGSLIFSYILTWLYNPKNSTKPNLKISNFNFLYAKNPTQAWLSWQFDLFH